MFKLLYPIFIFSRPTCPPHKCISYNPFRHMYIDLVKTKSDMSDTGMRLCISMLFAITVSCLEFYSFDTYNEAKYSK